VTKPNPENCKNCPSKCAYHCAQLSYTTQHGAVLIIFPLNLQTSITAQILSIGGEGVLLQWLGWNMSTGQWEVAVLHSWEGNYRSRIVLATHHRLWYIHVRAQWPKDRRSARLNIRVHTSVRNVVPLPWFHAYCQQSHSLKTDFYALYFKIEYCTCIFTARAMLWAVYAMALCLSVCVSVTSQSSTKMTKHRNTQTMPHDSPGTLVFWCQKLFRNSNGV